MSVGGCTATNARSISPLRFVVLSPTSADAVKIASQPIPHLVYPPKVPSRLCDKTNDRLMWRYDRSMAHIYVQTVTEPEPSSARNVGGTGAVDGPHAVPLVMRPVEPISPLESELDMFESPTCPLLIKFIKPRSPLLRPSRTTVHCDPQSQSRRTRYRWVVSSSGAAIRLQIRHCQLAASDGSHYSLQIR